MYSRRDVSPGMFKAVRWFARILWFLLIAGIVAAVSHANGETQRADRLEKERDELRQEVKKLKEDAAKTTAPKELKRDGGTIP